MTGRGYVPEEGKITAAIGPYSEKTDFKGSSTNAQSPYLGGVGIQVLGDVNKNGSLEIDLFLMNKPYLREIATKAQIEQTQLVQVNMGYRWWMTSVLSMSASIYSAYSMGDVSVVHSDFAPGTEPDTSARDITEYGFDFSTQVEVYRRNEFSVFVDGRYALSVTSKPNEESNHYGVLVGLRYVAQSKQEADEQKKVKTP